MRTDGNTCFIINVRFKLSHRHVFVVRFEFNFWSTVEPKEMENNLHRVPTDGYMFDLCGYHCSCCVRLNWPAMSSPTENPTRATWVTRGEEAILLRDLCSSSIKPSVNDWFAVSGFFFLVLF
jgi:hypothetical protein